MKPGNLRLQGAKSGGSNREMRVRCRLTRPRRARFLLVNTIRKELISNGYEKENFYFRVCDRGPSR